MSQEIIAAAIQGRHLLQFVYGGKVRVVEPHMLAYNEADRLALNGWWVRGHSASGGDPRWREYLVADISRLEVLEETFVAARPGYNPSGGRQFPRVLAALP